MSSKFFAGSNVAAQNQLVTWLNEAGLKDGNRRADLIRKIVEVLIHQTPQMIPTYLDHVLSYCNDKNTEVKKQVIAFIEEISKHFPNHLPNVVGHLGQFLNDTVIAVQKRAIQASSFIYRHTLLWICKSSAPVSNMQKVWEQVSELKLIVLNMIDNENEGIRTHSIKFLEEVLLLQTSSEVTVDDEFSLDELPPNLGFIQRRALEEESEHIFTLLLKFHNSQHISSVNLMACMTTLCLLAKTRPKYLPRVIQALGDLHTTLPPTLSQSQVNSVRKHLKMLLVKLVKQPTSMENTAQLMQLLLDIGMSQQEVNKLVPKERRNKRLGELKSGDQPSKRIRIDSPQSNSQSSDSNSRQEFSTPDEEPPKTLITEDIVFDSINNLSTVSSLIITTLLNNLPDEMPSNFVSIYKPVSNAGSQQHKRTLSRMLMNIIKGEPFPALVVEKEREKPSLSDLAAKIPLLKDDDDEKITLKNAVAKLQESTKAEREYESAVSKLREGTRAEHIQEEERKTKEKEKPIPPPTPTVPKLKQKVKMLKLQEITRPIPKEIKEKLLVQAVARILRAEKEASIGGAAHIRSKLVTLFASSYTPELRELVIEHILEDPFSRIDIAIAWLYEEYAYMQGFNRHPVTLQPKVHEKHDMNYNNLLCMLITQICEQGDPSENSKEILIRRIYCEAPLITDEAVDYLKHLVTEEKSALLALDLLEEIILTRLPRAHKYVAALICNVLSPNEEIRNTTIASALKIYQVSSEAVQKMIEKYANLYLGFIALNTPPLDLFVGDNARIRHKWSDDLYKICLNLIIAMFAVKEELIIEVARVYGLASSDAKRCVLRSVESPMRQWTDGQERPAFLKLLEACPKGSETLLTRLIHIFTDKTPPSPELVARVRDLYLTRVSDVRFIIPVLNGLTKEEIVQALPKLIKLNPVIVKEVFNKLLGIHNPHDEILPLSPAELLIELHLVDPNKADLKYIIKATALCFGEKQVYTQEVVSIVLQELVEQSEVPVLMMRSVLQALTLYPSLQGLVINILRRLVDKEIWSYKVAWEGWVKCVERAGRGGVGVLLSLPADVRGVALSAAPSLLNALVDHISNLSPAARAQLDPAVLQEVMSLSTPQPPAAPAPVPMPVEYVPPEAQYPSDIQYHPEQAYQPEPQYTMPLEPLPPGME